MCSKLEGMPQSQSTSSVSLLGVLAQHESIEWSQRNSISTSRFGTDFTTIRRIGRGSFGTIYQVQHKLDGRIYALKRVKLSNFDSDTKSTENGLSSTPDDAEVIREVQVLSRLQHENVVRYYGAWVERHDDAFIENETNQDRNNDTWGSESESIDLNPFNVSTHSSSSPIQTSKAPICHLCSNSYVDWEVSFEQWGLINSVLQPLDLCTKCYLMSLPEGIDPSEIQIQEQRQAANYLYIMMEYCDGTLIDIIKDCGDDKTELMSYFRQCIRGLDYLHKSGIIHRDIKPNNIFVLNKVVKIGDLGLATTLRVSALETVSDHTKEPDHNGQISFSSQVGTYLYTAPEVKIGIYSEKCDIYSMGVVFVEMLSNFVTGMERALTLESLQSGVFPDKMLTADQAQLARQMLHVDPSVRPSCNEIFDVLKDGVAPDRTIPELSDDCDLRSRIKQLEDLVAEKDLTIRKLHQMLRENGISPPC